MIPMESGRDGNSLLLLVSVHSLDDLAGWSYGFSWFVKRGEFFFLLSAFLKFWCKLLEEGT